ncbi:chain length determinant protein [Clostridium sp. CAG:1219]|nr:chain length determinant protein [Clostridium sp. CAG:1219]
MDEINLQEFLYNLRKKIPVLIIATLIGAILGGVNLIFMTKPMYESSTTLILVKSNSESNSSITQTDIVLNQKLIGTYSEIIKSRSVAKEVIDSLGIDMSVEELISSITVSSKTDTEILKITVRNHDNNIAPKIASTLANVFTKKVKEIYDINNVAIIDEAEVPTKPYNTNSLKTIGIFTFGALLVTVLFIFVVTYFSNTVKDEEELERLLNLRVLAIIPKIEE